MEQIINSEVSILTLSFKDLFTGKMLKYSLAPIFLSLIVLYILFFVVAGFSINSLGSMEVTQTTTSVQNGIPNTDTITQTIEGSEMMQWLLSSAFTSWMATFLIYALGMVVTLYLSIFVALIVIGFLTPTILKEIHKRHYSDVEMIGYSNIFTGIFLGLKWVLSMFVMFFLFIPLYFIPVVNIIAFNFPLYYFFHKMINYDVSSTICSKDEAKQISFFHANTLRLKTLALYLISLIPFVIFFATVFYIIYLGHSYFLETRKIREERY